MEVRKSKRIASLKTAFIAFVSAVNLMMEWPAEVFGIPPIAFPILFAFPILTVTLAASTWLQFQKPSWTEQPFLNPNRLAMSQFSAVLMLAVAISAAGGSLLRGGLVPDISMAAAAIGGGYALSIPIGLRLKARREADEAS